MSSVTGVEIGPDYCVLVRARQRESAIELAAVRLFDQAEWSSDVALQATRLRDVRRELRLPRRATVVAWGDARSVSPHSAEALRAAGFSVQHVLSPPDALALLAWSRPSGAADSPVAWLSINHHGAAIAVVRGSDVLYSHEFPWRIQASEQRVQAHLLRRYLYVAQLTPEIRRAMQEVEEEHGVAIGAAVVCGNVADLRSLTMPLIRELDIEFETLDSMEGFRLSDRLESESVPSAPAIRLAGAAAAYGEASGKAGSVSRWVGVAAGVFLAAGAAWWAFTVWAAHPPTSAVRSADRSTAISAQAVQPSGTAGNSEPPEARKEAAEPRRTQERPPAPQPSIGVSGADQPEGGSEPLRDPLPSVGGVLISADRRLAVVDGAVVGVGDRVGPRTVARIELDAVVLREPSGRHVRVPIRTKSGSS